MKRKDIEMADPYDQLKAQEDMQSRVAGAGSQREKVARMLLRKLAAQEKSAKNKMLKEDGYQQGTRTSKQLELSRQREQAARSQYRTVTEAMERVGRGLSIPKTLFKPTPLRGGGGQGLSGLATAMQKYNELF
jgi:hypothetical protein